MENNIINPGTRKPYSKPTIEQVKLMPDQAVLSACKTATDSGPGVTCEVGGIGCSQIAS